MELYTRAGEAGYAPAQAQVGYMYQNALGVPADYDLAMEWNNRAAEQGNPQGQEQIGDLYREGLGVTQSLDEASRWYAKAKDGGSERAAAMLDETDIGWAYGGHGGPPGASAPAGYDAACTSTAPDRFDPGPFFFGNFLYIGSVYVPKGVLHPFAGDAVIKKLT